MFFPFMGKGKYLYKEKNRQKQRTLQFLTFKPSFIHLGKKAEPSVLKLCKEISFGLLLDCFFFFFKIQILFKLNYSYQANKRNGIGKSLWRSIRLFITTMFFIYYFLFLLVVKESNTKINKALPCDVGQTVYSNLYPLLLSFLCHQDFHFLIYYLIISIGHLKKTYAPSAFFLKKS